MGPRNLSGVIQATATFVSRRSSSHTVTNDVAEDQAWLPEAMVCWREGRPVYVSIPSPFEILGKTIELAPELLFAS
jgi:hypothetical protein